MEATRLNSSAPLPDRVAFAIRTAIKDWLNWVFQLTDVAAYARATFRLLLFFGLFLFFTWLAISHQEDPSLILAPLTGATVPDGPAYAVLLAVIAEILRHMLAVWAPYLLVEQLAAMYLADIFEKEVDVAARFIAQAAFGDEYMSIRVREGKILEEQHGSPILQIGGPGYIIVELDSAVLLERPDGSTRVIGPTIGHFRSREVIHGFERIRQCVDLRDILDGQNVVSRSRDGIPVTAQDITYSYSIYRGENPQKTLQTPYPFDPAAIEAMVYVSTTRPVGTINKKADWTVTLPGKIAGNVIGGVTGYIGSNTLGEFLSNMGAPEEEALISREESIIRDSQALAGTSEGGVARIPIKAANVIGRSSQSQRIFEAVNKIARNNGKQINWIGVGTWLTPKEIILNNYTEAWKQSIENRKIQNEINTQREGMKLTELVTLLEDMPLTVYAQLYSQIERKQITEQDAINEMLDEYHKHLQNAEKLYQDKNMPIPDTVANALAAISRLKYHDVSEGYSIGSRIESAPSQDIVGATLYTIRTGVFSGNLTGFSSSPINFDFGNSRELTFAFDLAASPAGAVSVLNGTHRELDMRFDDLYSITEYHVTLLPGATCELLIVCQQNGQVVGSQRLRLNA